MASISDLSSVTARARVASEPAGRSASIASDLGADPRAGQAAAVAGRSISDRVEVSDLAVYLSKLKQLPDVRADLVSRVRTAIQNGEYESTDKLEASIDLLAGEIRL